jgi:outer membrane receptor protein involved in Fe transport
LSARFFSPSGVSFLLKSTYYNQSGDFQKRDSDTTFSGRDDFWILDLGIQYRFPKRFGLISVGVKNLLDETFNYQDINPVEPATIPERFFFGRLTLSF